MFSKYDILPLQTYPPHYMAAHKGCSNTFVNCCCSFICVCLVPQLAETGVAAGDGEAEGGVEEAPSVDPVQTVQLVRPVLTCR